MSTGTATLKIDELINNNKELPSLPAALMQVIQETGKATASAGAIADLIARDQSLSAKLLKLSNSAYYGMPGQVDDLVESVMILGMKNVRNMALAAGTHTWMNKPLKGYLLEPKQMWNHSFGVAIGSRIIAAESKKLNPDIAFTAGLLHDIGKVALSAWLEDKIKYIIKIAQSKNLPFDEAERQVLGFDHTQVGERLGMKWNLPDNLIQAIRYHHKPNECDPTSSLVDSIHLGNYLTMSMGYGLGGDGLHYEVFGETFDRLGIQPENIDKISSQFVSEFEEYDQIFKELGSE